MEGGSIQRTHFYVKKNTLCKLSRKIKGHLMAFVSVPLAATQRTETRFGWNTKGQGEPTEGSTLGRLLW